jgi:hypothetical protein
MRNIKEESSEGHGDRVGGRNRGIKPRFSSGAHLSYSLRKIIIWILVDLSWKLEMRKQEQKWGRQGGKLESIGQAPYSQLETAPALSGCSMIQQRNRTLQSQCRCLIIRCDSSIDVKCGPTAYNHTVLDLLYHTIISRYRHNFMSDISKLRPLLYLISIISNLVACSPWLVNKQKKNLSDSRL